MVRPGHRTHHPLPARAILPRDPARRTAQPEGTRGRYERGLVSQTPPYLQRHTRRCAATFLAGTGFCHVSPSRRGKETPLSTPGRHYLCTLPRCLMAKVELMSYWENGLRHGERCFPRSETHGDCCPQRRLAVVSVTPVTGCMCSAARNSIRTCCQAECCCRSECADEVCQ